MTGLLRHRVFFHPSTESRRHQAGQDETDEGGGQP
jgi:hypothetical protein